MDTTVLTHLVRMETSGVYVVIRTGGIAIFYNASSAVVTVNS